jgi:hypothetical protein
MFLGGLAVLFWNGSTGQRVEVPTKARVEVQDTPVVSPRPARRTLTPAQPAPPAAKTHLEQITQELAPYFPKTPLGQTELRWTALLAARRDSKDEKDDTSAEAAALWEHMRNHAPEAVETAAQAFRAIPDQKFDDRFEVFSIVMLMAVPAKRLDVLRDSLLAEGQKNYQRGEHYDELDRAPLIRGLALYLMQETDRARQASVIHEIYQRQTDPAVREKIEELAQRTE